MSRLWYKRTIECQTRDINRNLIALNGQRGKISEFRSEPLYDMLASSHNPCNLALRILRTLRGVENVLKRSHQLNGGNGNHFDSCWKNAFERLDALSNGDERGLVNPHRQWSSDGSD